MLALLFALACVSTSGDCDSAPDGDDLEYNRVQVGWEVWSDDTFVIEDEQSWEPFIEELDEPDEVDFSTHVVAGAHNSAGGCNGFGTEITAAVSDGAWAHLEVTFDERHLGNCDMWVSETVALAIPHHDTVTVCKRALGR